MADYDDPVVRQYMNSDDMNMAIASEISYSHANNLASNSTDIANDKTNVTIEERLQNHKLIPAYTNEYVTTIKNMPKNEYIMAVRGTNPANIHDLASDAQILFNQKVNRVDTIEKIYDSFRKEQPTAKLTLTGHSLGAYVAHTIANKNNEFFVGFDLPASPLGIVSDQLPEFLEKINPQVRHRVYFNQSFDAVSIVGKYTNVNDNLTILPQRESTRNLFGSHSIKNYIYENNPDSKMLKTTSKKNTYYSMPHMTTAERTAKSVPVNRFFKEKHLDMIFKEKNVDENKFFKEKKPSRLRTGYENECLTNPTLKKCKQLIERKFY